MKKIVYLAALMLIMVQTSTSAATKRALVIGIGQYPKESGWSVINGDKDVPVIVEMLTINGFKKENIETLSNEQATKKQIRASIRHLASISKPGDKIYIHFSGHGQQVLDVHGDEPEGLDEAWIPYDAQAKYEQGKYEGENHILDDELYNWFSAIADKVGNKGHLTVSVDACHSGDCSRGSEEDSVVVRGVLLDGAQEVFKAVSSWFSKDETPKATTAPKVERWTVISACQPDQTNREFNGNGSLTTALREIADQLNNMTAEQVRVKVRNWMQNRFGTHQLPMVNQERKNLSFL